MKKIAIIGSGISGLTCAYRLTPHFDVTLIEAADRLGGHTATVDIETPRGRYAIDTGFIVFNDWTYPNFIQMLNELNVPFVDSDMGFSVRNDQKNLEYNGKDLRRLFVQKRNFLRPAFYKMILDILRFGREAPQFLNEENEMPLGQYLDEQGYSAGFRQDYILPMGGAIWSATPEQMLQFPARFFIQFFKNHGMLSVDERPIWKVIPGGSRTYIPAILKTLKNAPLLNSPVEKISRSAEGITLDCGGKNPTKLAFDHVIFACHSDQALKILGNSASAAEKEILGAFRYQDNQVTLHQDASLMPKRRQAWASWNTLIGENRDKKSQAAVTLTYYMNELQNLKAAEDFFVSLNLDAQIDAKKILRQFTYAHPVFPLEALAFQKRWTEISYGNTFFCGAYWRYGFHEDGVWSALQVVDALRKERAHA